MEAAKHRLIAIRFPDGLPETEPLVIVQQSTFDQAREAIKEMLKAYDQLLPGIGRIACKDYQNINEAPIKAREALAAMEATL